MYNGVVLKKEFLAFLSVNFKGKMFIKNKKKNFFNFKKNSINF